MTHRPENSVPDIFDGEADKEGYCRLVTHPRVDDTALAKSHFAARPSAPRNSTKSCVFKTLLLPFEITPGLSAVLNDDGGVAVPRRC